MFDNLLFNSIEDAKYYNSVHRFSILSLIDDSYKVNNLYEMLIEYPQIPFYTRFTQVTNPNTNTTNTGFKHISGQNVSNFQGLARSADVTETYLDGTPSVYTPDWWFAIGTYKLYQTHYMPGPYNYNGSSNRVKWVDLWIRIENISLLINMKSLIKCNTVRCKVVGFSYHILYCFILI